MLTRRLTYAEPRTSRCRTERASGSAAPVFGMAHPDRVWLRAVAWDCLRSFRPAFVGHRQSGAAWVWHVAALCAGAVEAHLGGSGGGRDLLRPVCAGATA